MSNGEAVVDQGNMLSKNFTVEVDVSLLVETDELQLEPGLEEKIQSVLVPEMAGCSNVSRRLVRGKDYDSSGLRADIRKLDAINYVIGNGLVTVECDTEATCEEGSEQPCYRCSVALELLLKGDERILNLLTIITEVFAVDSLAEVLEFGQPFSRIVAVSVESGTPTEAPTPSPTPLASDPPTDAPSSGPTEVPSSRPTLAPVPFPTTDAPTKEPTNLPSLRPSKAPIRSPTPAPTLDSTPRPTPSPTRDPTPGPKPNPTPPPTREPTFEPTPEESLFECPPWNDWFEGPFEMEIVSESAYWGVSSFNSGFGVRRWLLCEVHWVTSGY
jgi:hypothetical protein